MRIAVLGASSFSGSAFVAVARAGGHDVLPMSRPAFDLVWGQKRIAEAVERFRPDVFVNYAALNMVAESWKHYADYYQTNVIGVARLAEMLSRCDWLQRFVQVSTPEVYGNAPEGAIVPGEAFLPSTPYAVSRAATDMHLLAMHRSFGFPVSFTRTVNVYGPAQQPYRIIPKTVLKILRGQKLKLDGGGESVRSFIHVRDMAEGTLAVAVAGAPGQVYHFATDDELKIKTVVARICSALDVAFGDVVEIVSDRPGKDRMYHLDWEDSKTELKWCPKVSFLEGIDDTVFWFVAHAADYANHSLEYEHRA